MMMTTTKAQAIADQAANLISGDRAINHGDKLENHQKIADVWNGILISAGKRPTTALDAHDVANLMEGLKIARRYCGAFNLDDYVDGAGYAACAGEIRSALIERERVTASWVAAAITDFASGSSEAPPAKPPLVYLATPYSKYPDGMTLAFSDAACLAARLLVGGMRVYSPIAHTHPIAKYGNIDPLDHSIWLPFDEAMMAACDELLVARMDGWEESKGIAHEIAFFEKAGKPIRYLDPANLSVQACPIRKCVALPRKSPLAQDKTPSQQGGSSA